MRRGWARSARRRQNRGVGPDLVLFHGSEYKDHVVWSAAADVCERLGADGAYAHESYTLCAGAPIAIRHTAAQLRVGDIDRALLVTASREEDLVDYEDDDASFMFNFGSGASATVLEADPATERTSAVVRESAAVTDGSFSRDVVMPAGGSRDPPTHDTVEAGAHSLTVPDPNDMKERLADVSAPAFLGVADDALAASGYERGDVDFLALTHMKRSFHEYLCAELGVDQSESYYLDDYGHVQSADQVLALCEGSTATESPPVTSCCSWPPAPATRGRRRSWSGPTTDLHRRRRCPRRPSADPGICARRPRFSTVVD